MEESDLDSDLNDPDMEELALLRKALGSEYTQVKNPFSQSLRCYLHCTLENLYGLYRMLVAWCAHDVFCNEMLLCGTQEGNAIGVEDDTSQDGQPCDEQLTGRERRVPHTQALSPLDTDREPANIAPIASAAPTAAASSRPQQQAGHQPHIRGHRDTLYASDDDSEDEEVEEDGDEDNDSEEWEPAPTRTDLLRNAVQYLRQASAEPAVPDYAELSPGEQPAQVRLGI